MIIINNYQLSMMLYLQLNNNIDKSEMSSSLQLLFEQNFIKQSIAQFVRKIYLLLCNKEYQQIISWDEDKKTIVIKDKDRIVQQVLQRVFKQNTLKSFIRQLNMYNFKKVRKQKEEYLYFQNQHFRKDNIQNLIFIKRKQRGYIQKSELLKIETKTTLQKYNVFAYGILNKLKDKFYHISQQYPQLCNIIKYQPSINVEYINQIQSSFNPIQQQQISFYNMFESFQSNKILPGFKSNISIVIANQIP